VPSKVQIAREMTQGLREQGTGNRGLGLGCGKAVHSLEFTVEEPGWGCAWWVGLTVFCRDAERVVVIVNGWCVWRGCELDGLEVEEIFLEDEVSLGLLHLFREIHEGRPEVMFAVKVDPEVCAVKAPNCEVTKHVKRDTFID
jgi:hypothetical protein